MTCYNSNNYCFAMLISRKRVPSHPFLLNGMLLEQVETFKYLGVLLSSDLSWYSHISSICTKVKKLLYRRFSNNVQSERLLEMYKLLVRPHLEYVAPVWDLRLLGDIKSLENVQKLGVKMCLNNWNSGYQDLCDISQLPILLRTGDYNSTLHKIVHRLFYFPSDVFISQPSRYNSDVSLLCQPFARTNALHLFRAPSQFGITYLMMHFSHILLTPLSLTLHLFSCNLGTYLN